VFFVKNSKMISNTKLKVRTHRKMNPVLVETLEKMRKNPAWIKIAKILSSSTRNYSSVNLYKIEKETSTGDTVVIPGKILSKGDVSKKIRVCALSVSEKAMDKLNESKSEVVSILEEVTKNPKADGIKLIK
jgi:large subunit ribosomal protein L18e